MDNPDTVASALASSAYISCAMISSKVGNALPLELKRASRPSSLESKRQSSDLAPPTSSSSTTEDKVQTGSTSQNTVGGVILRRASPKLVQTPPTPPDTSRSTKNFSPAMLIRHKSSRNYANSSDPRLLSPDRAPDRRASQQDRHSVEFSSARVAKLQAEELSARRTSSVDDVRKLGCSTNGDKRRRSAANIFAKKSSTNGEEKRHDVDTSMETNVSKGECSHWPKDGKKGCKHDFCQAFPDIAAQDTRLQCYRCALVGDILIQGRLHITNNWFCFNSKLLSKGGQVRIPIHQVTSITKAKIALVIPNAISVTTADNKYVFGSLLSRNNTYRLMVHTWKQLQKINQYSTDGEDVMHSLRINDSHHASGYCSSSSDVSSNHDSNTSRRPSQNTLLADHDVTLEENYTENRSPDEFVQVNSEETTDKLEAKAHSRLQGSREIGKSVTRNKERVDSVSKSFHRDRSEHKSHHISNRLAFTAPAECRSSESHSLSLHIIKIPSWNNIIIFFSVFIVVVLMLSSAILTYKLANVQSSVNTKGKVREQRSMLDGSTKTTGRRSYTMNTQKIQLILETHLSLLDRMSVALKALKESATESQLLTYHKFEKDKKESIESTPYIAP